MTAQQKKDILVKQFRNLHFLDQNQIDEGKYSKAWNEELAPLHYFSFAELCLLVDFCKQYGSSAIVHNRVLVINF